MECSKRDTCLNRDNKCFQCNAMADIYNTHPCYKKFLTHVEFMTELECLALGNNLRLIMQRASIGCGILFCFKDDISGKHSKSLTWVFEKEHVSDLFDRLQKLADEFKKEKSDD